MSKRDKNRDRKGPHRPSQYHFHDLTSERHLASQIAKARDLFEKKAYDENAKLLEELVAKYPGRGQLYELQGQAYAATGAMGAACKAMELALAVAPSRAIPLLRFNLAQGYLMTGFLLLAHEQSQQIDCYQLSEATTSPTVISRCQTLKEMISSTLNLSAADHKQPLDEHIAYNIILDRGRLALQRNEYAAARAHFEESVELEPEMESGRLNLALVCLLDGDLVGAAAQSQYVLDNISPEDPHAFVNLVRVALSQGDVALAHSYLERIKQLPFPSDPNDSIKFVEMHALLGEDKQVYDYTQQMLEDNKVLTSTESYRSTVVYCAVAAANLGNSAEAVQMLAERRDHPDDPVLKRTWAAFEANERGPLPGGRFFYFNMMNYYAVVYTSYNTLVEEAAKSDDAENYEIVRPLLEKHGLAAVELMTGLIWMNPEEEISFRLLSQAADAPMPEAVEMVRRLASGLTRNEELRQVASRALAAKGLSDSSAAES